MHEKIASGRLQSRGKFNYHAPNDFSTAKPCFLATSLFCQWWTKVWVTCRQLGIQGVTPHSYRYAWAERAKVAGPERFAQEALGYNSKAVHRAYTKRALMKIPSLEDYEKQTGAEAELTT